MARRKKRKSGANKFLVFMILVLLGVTIYLGYRVYDLQKRNEVLETQVEELQVTVTILKGGTSTPTP